MMTTTLPPTAELRIDTSFPSPGTARLAASGEIDIATAPLLATRLWAVIEAHHPVLIDLDMVGVDFLDCDGIGVLVGIHDTAKRAGCHVRISHPQPMISKLLDVLEVHAMFSASLITG